MPALSLTPHSDTDSDTVPHRLWTWVLVSVSLHVTVVLGWHELGLGSSPPAPVMAPTLALRIVSPQPAPPAPEPVREPAPEPLPRQQATPPTPVAGTIPEPPVVEQTEPKPVIKPQPKPAPPPRPAAKPAAKAKPPVEPPTPVAKPSASTPIQAVSPSPTAAPPKPTNTGLSSSARADLASLLRNAIENHKRYPYTARRRGQQGTASVDFTLTPDGSVEGVGINRSSGHQRLDQAALEAVRGIAPFHIAGNYLNAPTDFQLDIAFRLRAR